MNLYRMVMIFILFFPHNIKYNRIDIDLWPGLLKEENTEDLKFQADW